MLHTVDFQSLNNSVGLASLDDACQNWGFFELVGHPIDPQLCEAMLQQMEHFFQLPTEVKQGCRRSAENHWGYYDQELTKNVRDWKEIFDVGREHGACIPQWPAGHDAFQATTLAFFQACRGLSLDLVSALARALGSDGTALRQGFAEDTSYLRLNHYPLCDRPSPADTPTGPPHGHFGISHHSDAGAVTVLLHDGCAGLQVEKNGHWHGLHSKRGSLLINIGDVVQVWSNDRYHAPLHRVLASSKNVRYSAPFFLNPSYSTHYAPLAEACADKGPHYRSIRWGEFRESRAAGDYADYGSEIQISDYRVKG
jgi:isopenicillin N synthase-like dioxygenase